MPTRWRIAAIAMDGSWTLRARKTDGAHPANAAGETFERALNEIASHIPDDAAAVDLRIAFDAADRALAAMDRQRIVFVTTLDPDDPTADRDSVLPAAGRTIHVDERVLADGTVRRIPQIEDFAPALERARAEGFTACAIGFANARTYPIHEQLVFAHASRMGFAYVSASYEVGGDHWFHERVCRAITDAGIGAAVRAVSEAVEAATGTTLPSPTIRFVGGGGVLSDAPDIHPVDLLGSVDALQRNAQDADPLDALLDMPLHASRSYNMTAGTESDERALRIALDGLRDACFAELTGRGARADTLAWFAQARTADGRIVDITGADGLTAYVHVDDPIVALEVEAIGDP